MPHYKNNEKATIGDKVVLEFRIAEVYESEFCSCRLTSVDNIQGASKASLTVNLKDILPAIPTPKIQIQFLEDTSGKYNTCYINNRKLFAGETGHPCVSDMVSIFMAAVGENNFELHHNLIDFEEFWNDIAEIGDEIVFPKELPEGRSLVRQLNLIGLEYNPADYIVE